MLAMSKSKNEESFGEFIASLRVVPLSIAYELDPCDALKAAELQLMDTTGRYEKAEHEDVASIAAGIRGDKGLVHVAFGEPLGEGHDTPEAVAAELDRQIIRNYRLHRTNLYAWHMLHGSEPQLDLDPAELPGSCSEAEFRQRMQSIPAGQRDYALAIYANAIASKQMLLQARSVDAVAG